MNIADMNIAFDGEGKMMNVTKLNPDKFGELPHNKKLNTFLNEDMTEVVKSDVYSNAQEKAQAMKEKLEGRNMNSSELTQGDGATFAGDAGTTLNNVMFRTTGGE
jgi:hypothetical protein